MPTMALAYHSASTRVSPLGVGWALMGASTIERVPATLAQDGIRGASGIDHYFCQNLIVLKVLLDITKMTASLSMVNVS